MTSKQKSWLLPLCAVFIAAGTFLGIRTDSFVPPLSGALICLLAVIVFSGAMRAASICVLCLALGCLSSSIAFHPALPAEGEHRIAGIIAGEFSARSGGRFSVQLSDVSVDGTRVSGGAYWTFYSDEFPGDFAPGRYVSFTARVYHPSGVSNPGGYDFREDLLRRGITFGVYGITDPESSEAPFFSLSGVSASVRHAVSARLIAVMGEEQGSYASALLLGVRSGLSYEDRQAFSDLGIAHILSVSGFHVGILSAFLALILKKLRAKPCVRLAVNAAVLAAYCLLCGLAQPVIRASLLVLLILTGRILNRPRSGLHLLSAAFILQLLVSPVQITGASFQMTFGAVMGITLVTPFIRGKLSPASRFARTVCDASAVYIGAQLGILLPELYHFQSFPLLGVLMNVPVTLIGSAVIAADWLILILLPAAPLASLAAYPVSLFSRACLTAVRFLGSLPGITLWTPAPGILTLLGVIGAVLSLCPLFRAGVRIRLPAFVLSLAVTVLSLIPPAHTTTEYIQFSAGNADAAVIWDMDTVTVIDTGENGSDLGSYLRRLRLTPDAVILTHLHSDHAGGLYALSRDRIPVSVIYLPYGAEKAQISSEILILLDQYRASGTEIRYLSRGDSIPLPSGSVQVLWPEYGKVRPGQDANNSSLVCRITLRGTGLLQTGDISGAYEGYSAVPADILKMSHHGSESSTSDEFLAAVSPSAVLLSCGSGERHSRVSERLGGIPLYSTDDSGAVTVSFYDGGFTVTPFLITSTEVLPDDPQ